MIKNLNITPALAVVLSVVISSSLVIICRYLGVWQSLEWWAVDWFFKLRPVELRDPRIVIVGITEKDIALMQTSTIKDQTLAQLLEKILVGKPSAIGVNILRDIPQPPGRQELLQVFQNHNHVYAVGKQTGIKGHPDYDLVAPPPIPKSQITDISSIYDGDRVKRRGFLYPITGQEKFVPSLATALAFHYLGQEKIYAQAAAENKVVFNGQDFIPFKLNELTFLPFQKNTGPYLPTAGEWGYQILINWRNTGHKFDFEVIEMTSVLEGQINPSIFQDRIVLVGYLSPIKEDKVFTPLSRGTGDTPLAKFGVEIQAQLTSQIISAVLDERPLIKLWSEPSMSLWVVFWSGIGTGCIYLQRNKKWMYGLIYLVISGSVLFSINGILFIYLGWLNPLIPPLASMWLGGTIFVIYNLENKRKIVTELQEELKKRQQQTLSLDKKELQKIAEQMRNNLVPSLQRAMIFSERLENKLENLERMFAHNSDSLNHQEITEAFWLEIREITNLAANLDQSFQEFRSGLNSKLSLNFVEKEKSEISASQIDLEDEN